VDGMILSIVDETNESLLDALRQVTVPVILVDREVSDEVGASSVVADHRSGMRDAVAHLIALGHRNIALIGGSRGTLPGREREAGLEEAVRASGEVVATDVLDGPFSQAHGAEATARLLDRTDPPTAIVCGSNQLLVGCLSVLNDREVSVGEDVSLVTCDDVPASVVYRPPLASISRDMVGLGRSAAELLLRRITDAGAPERVVLPTRFTPRASCAPPRDGLSR